MENHELEIYSHEPRFSTSIETPEMQEARLRLSMTSRRERNEIIRNIEDDLAKKLDPIWGIHGVQMILKSLWYYKWTIDGRIRSSQSIWIIPALVEFQKSQQGMPEQEYGKFGDATIAILWTIAQEKWIRLPPKSSDRSLWDVGNTKENKDQFLNLYGGLIDSLTGSLNLRKNIVLGISKIESSYGTNAKDTPGGTGVMQLTRVVFDDMAGQTAEWKIDKRKIGKYHTLFQALNIDNLKNAPFWDKKLGETLPEEVWSRLSILSNKETSSEQFSKIIKELQQYERWSMKNYHLHTLNMILASVYIGFISKPWMTIRQIWMRYNGHPKHKVAYGEELQKYVQAYPRFA